MTEKKTTKGGAGKFFLGAALGALAGAIAGRFISNKAENEEKCDCKEDCDCKEECECKDGKTKA